MGVLNKQPIIIRQIRRPPYAPENLISKYLIAQGAGTEQSAVTSVSGSLNTPST